MKSFKIYFTLITALMALSCCSDIMDDKADIDAKHTGNPALLPTVTIATPSNVTYESATVVASWSNAGDEIMEAGFIYSTDEAFNSINVVSPSDFKNSQVTSALKLDSETKYFVKAYVQTRSNGVAYSDVVSLTTAKAPVFIDTYLFGNYEAIDIDITTGEQEGDPYDVTIKQDGSAYNRVLISNIWGGGRTIVGVVDFVKKTITVDYTNVIYVHSSYGNCYMWGLVIEGGELVDYARETIAYYDDKGNIEFSPWAAHVSAGDFGYYVTLLEKK